MRGRDTSRGRREEQAADSGTYAPSQSPTLPTSLDARSLEPPSPSRCTTKVGTTSIPSSSRPSCTFPRSTPTKLCENIFFLVVSFHS